MHLIAPTDTARTIAQHELRGAVHLGLWPMGWLHPGEKVVANSRPLWPSFRGKSEGKDAYTSFEVPEKRYEELDFFGKIIPDMFNKIVTLALEWTKSLKALPTSLSFPPRATIKIPGSKSSFFTQENVSSHKLLYLLPPFTTDRLQNRNPLRIHLHIHHHSTASRAPKSWTLPPPLQTNPTLRIRRLWKRRPAPGRQGWWSRLGCRPGRVGDSEYSFQETWDPFFLKVKEEQKLAYLPYFEIFVYMQVVVS